MFKRVEFGVVKVVRGNNGLVAKGSNPELTQRMERADGCKGVWVGDMTFFNLLTPENRDATRDEVRKKICVGVVVFFATKWP